MTNYNIYILKSVAEQLKEAYLAKFEIVGVYFNLKESKKIARDLVKKGAYAVMIETSNKAHSITLNSSPKKWWDTRNCPDSWSKQ